MGRILLLCCVGRSQSCIDRGAVHFCIDRGEVAMDLPSPRVRVSKRRDDWSDDDTSRSVRLRPSLVPALSALPAVCSSFDLLSYLLGFVGLWTDSATMMKVAYLVGPLSWSVVRTWFWALPPPPLKMTVDRLRMYPRGSFDFRSAVNESFRYLLHRCDKCHDPTVWSTTRVTESSVSEYTGFVSFVSRECPRWWVKPGKYGPGMLPLYCDDCLTWREREELLDAIRYYGEY